MRIVFMGTPDFSVPALVSLVEAGHEIAAVVTQPDKPKNRGKAVMMTPVKEKALSYGFTVYQPVKAREESFVEVLKGINPDVMVVVAFGQLLPKCVLDIPRFGCINIHASLLPKYRGAAPIQWAVIDGEQESGITTMYMSEGLDTGDMIEKTVVVFDDHETGGSLHDKLCKTGGELIVSTLQKIEAGTAVRTPQPEESSTRYASRLTKTSGDIDWTKDAVSIERLIRGLNPWPSAYTKWDGRMIKLWMADALEEAADGVPGQIVRIQKDALVVKTGKGLLAVKELQIEGKKRMDAASFLRGYAIPVGSVLERSV